jgi:hypothetical protein
LVFRVPVQAGPFDLGTVVTRAAAFVDPQTTQVTVTSESLPQILEGVPITYRTIHVDVDRSGFALNPTSCGATSVEAKLDSSSGTVATASDRFELGGCRELGFKPRLRIRLRGKTHRGGHPRLRATLVARPGDANIARAQVSLPRSEFLDQAHIDTVCTRVQFAEERCPPGSVYGHARALTPLLDYPLVGPVYLRSSSHELPDLVAALRGPASQPIEVDLNGRIDSVRGGIRTTFEAVPDAPVSKFVLEMKGGHKGLLVNSTEICRRKHHAAVKLAGHNGALTRFAPALASGCRR